MSYEQSGRGGLGDGNALREAERRIWLAAPHELADVAEETVRKLCDTDAAEIYLTDYRMAYLQPVASGQAPIALAGSPSGRALATGEPVLEPPATASPGTRRLLHLPLTVLGNRLGILRITLPDIPSAEQRTELLDLAATLSRALEIADRATDRYRQARRRERLTLAAEMQWELLPGRVGSAPEYEFAGQLEPAYAVAGDNFDWSAARDTLLISVTNGMGEGTASALLTQLAVGAMRNARRSGGDLLEQCGLADETIFRHYGGRQHVATLLLSIDLATGVVTAVDAGSPVVYRIRGGTVERVPLDRQLPLGMFGDTPYTEERFTVRHGDRLVIVSDGMHAAHLPGARAGYEEEFLMRDLAESRLQPPADLVRTLLQRFVERHQGTQLADDAVVVCLDWKGR
ncbi:PP2C family protein-serine/threonine phosphatase [Actinoallomurus sp. NPDC052308]|uniref:PP2C family protein-serine/threonine phosphatase n=1 Tax=Actinoallomurus sp. NPDC052308 TaxID=3155530 RepID=UPI003423A6A4